MQPTNNGTVTRLQPGRSERVARDDCPCRECRRARLRAEVSLDPTLFRQASDWSRFDWAVFWIALGCSLGTFWIVVKVLAPGVAL